MRILASPIPPVKLRQLQKAQRKEILRAYKKATGQGLLSFIARAVRADPATVSRAFNRKHSEPAPVIVALLEREINALLASGNNIETIMRTNAAACKAQTTEKTGHVVP